jgi:pimeloyl-ACP methyl ester carboxylesterase
MRSWRSWGRAFGVFGPRCRWAPTDDPCARRLSKRPIPDELVDQWLEPALTTAAIRRDLRKYAGDTRQGRRQLVKANPHLADFAKPVLVVWAAEDKVMPAAAGRRLAASFPDSRFVEIPDSRTLIPIDQPRALADAIATFVSNH